MREIFGLQVRQQIPMFGFGGTVHAKPFSFRFGKGIVAEGVLLYKTRTVQDRGVFLQFSGGARVR